MDIRKIIFTVSLVFIIGWAVSAQEEEAEEIEAEEQEIVYEDEIPIDGSPIEGEPSFRLSETDSGLLFFQRLTWEEARYAVRYTVILERKRENLDAYVEVLRRNTDLTYVDVSVPPGDYRYRVLSFNVLGLLDSQSDWEYFMIIPALYPSILDFSPKAFYFDRLTPRIINLVGENLLLDAEIYMEGQNLFDEDGEQIILWPIEIIRNELGENVRLIFDDEDLLAGTYEIVLRNPGGLVARAGPFTIAMAKPYDINVAGGYTPMLAVFGQKDYFLDHVFLPGSFAARASFVPFKWDIGFVGAEVTTFWAYISSDQDKYKTSAHLLALNFGGLYQYWLKPRFLALNGRAGIGIAGIFNYHFVYPTGKLSDSTGTMAFSFSLGGSAQWFFYKMFFFEAGLDYVQVVHSEIPMGFIRLGLFGGYQF